MPDKWLTNVRTSEINEVRKDMLKGYVDRAIVGGSPQPIDGFDEVELSAMGYMGLWEVHPGRPAA